MRTKAYRTITILGLFFALAAISAHAQVSGTVEAKVPFDFHAGETRLSAGTYSVTLISARVMRLRSADGQTNIVLQAPLTAAQQEGGSSARLVFRRRGEQYFLAQVWPKADYGRELYMSAQEQSLSKELKLAKRSEAKPVKVEVAARAKR